MSFWKRIKAFGPRSQSVLDRDIEREIQNHLDLEAAESGKHSAHRMFGNVAQVKEDIRGEWGWMRLEQFARDVTHAWRQLRRNPGFSAIAITTLALGIGVNAAMFSAVDAVLLRPLPYTDAGGLVMIWSDMGKHDASRYSPTPAEWIEWRRLNTVFTDLAATQSATATISGEGEPEQPPARKATWNLWSVLGVQPALGRVFSEEEDVNGIHVVVISYGFWKRRFGGSPSVIGRTMMVNDNPHEVIGVMPRDFYFMPSRDIDIWLPASFPPRMRTNLSWHDAEITARLKPATTTKQAQEHMAVLSRQVTAKDFRGPRSVIITPLRAELAGSSRTALIMLLCASAAVLLIACVNLANLLMSRGAVRQREVAVRAALGAGRGRLLTQFLVESLVLSAFGAIAGLALALPAMGFLETLVPETMAAVRLTLDWRVLVFSGAVTIAAALTFGLAPAIGGSRLALQADLRDGGRGSAGARSHWFQHSLIVVETALAVALLTCGGLLLQTFEHLRQVDLGIKSDKLLTFQTPLFRYKDFNSRVAFVNTMLDKLRAIPGVTNAGAISRIPLTVTDQATFYLLDGQSRAAISKQVALNRVVSRDYFATVGAHLREGRFFDTADRQSPSPVAVINDSFANRNFPDRSPLGAKVKFGQTGEKGYWYTIVGVVREIRDRGITEELKPTIYRVQEQADQTGDQANGIVIRTAVEPGSIVSAVRQVMWSLDRNQPLARVQTMQEIVDRQLSTPSQSTTLLGAFAVLALALASIGLYGVLSYAVTRRTNEIGVRMALGAQSRQILVSFIRRGLGLTMTGLVLGLLLAWGAARLMTKLLHGFQPDYSVAAALVAVVLVVVAAAACFFPARRASRIDPVIALQHE